MTIRVATANLTRNGEATPTLTPLDIQAAYVSRHGIRPNPRRLWARWCGGWLRSGCRRRGCSAGTCARAWRAPSTRTARIRPCSTSYRADFLLALRRTVFLAALRRREGGGGG